MNSIDVIRRLHQHRAWVNQNLLDACAALSNDQLRQPFDIGQGSVWKSLVHMYAAEWVWLETLLGDEFPTLPGDVPGKLPGNQQGVNPIADFAELRNRWCELEGRWKRYFADLTPEGLQDVVYKVSTSYGAGQKLATNRSDVLLHVALHAHYTVAQVMNMLRRCGCAALPHNMLISLARMEAAGHSS
jgi:uncharacterized damage-inducible protein DinB